MDIYPSILAKDKIEFASKVERVRPLGLHVHVDVMDGVFVPNRTWASPYEVENLLEEMHFNVHLMVYSPEHEAPTWAVTRAKRVYFHFESTHRHKLILRAIGDEKKMGIALNPNTPVSAIGHLIDKIGSVLIMSVEPGQSGQTFMDSALVKIREIKRMRPNLHVAIDGGIKDSNISLVAEAGADAVIVGSALTDQSNPYDSLNKLKSQLG
jgi:ribulose-phosphate 3-epimerase